MDDFNDEVPKALEDDEIIKYASKAGGYFITHDIYEEWALDKIIERDFCNRENYKQFFNSIGNSLPIRRAFRNWLSEKLYINEKEVKYLIEESIHNDDIEKHWKDEILTSVLLSNYCSRFFEIFKLELLKEFQQNNELENDFQSHYEYDGLLYKLLFLLRVACKEADESVFNTYGLPKTDKNKTLFETIFIQPKGEGWSCLIEFLNKHKEDFGLCYINLILPVLEDWNNKNRKRKGKTTQNASQLALFYYEKIMNEEYSFKYNAMKKRLIQIIFNGSFEIKEDLKKIFQSIISKKETNDDNKYYQLVHTILTSPMENIAVVRNLPEQVIQLANLFWAYQPKKTKLKLGSFSLPNPSPNLEECFSIKSHYEFKYSPSNAFNTPILELLASSYKQTIDFILSFTNKSVESFAKSKFKGDLTKVELFIDDKISIKQYSNDRLWNVYRGTQVAPSLLKSIHMALERYFLYNCKNMHSNILEKHLLYLLKNSQSSSISAVVASVVLAYPEKTFNIAKILFQTKEFFLCDNTRRALDYISINRAFNPFIEDPLIRNERIDSNKLEHRKKALENLALQYQIVAPQGMTEKEFKNRQETLWKIFDHYYEQLPNQESETEEDKTWRLCLARMDIQKMKQTPKQIDGKSYVEFKPELDSKLQKHREDALKKNNEGYEYTSLKLWATYKFENKEDHKRKEYLRYENNTRLVVKETKEIIEKFKSDNMFDVFNRSIPVYTHSVFQKDYSSVNTQTRSFYLMNSSIPVYTCSVMIHNYWNELRKEDRVFCKNIIMDYASLPLQENYHHQITDGTGIAIQMLSHLLKFFPKDKVEIKMLLFSLLISIQEEETYRSSIKTIENMWSKNFKDAHSIFLGYLLLKQDFDSVSKKPQNIDYEGIYKYSNKQKLKKFLDEHQKKIDLIIKNKLTSNFLIEHKKLDEMYMDILITAFQMLPFKVEYKEHKDFIKNIIPICLKNLVANNQKSNNWGLKMKFLEKFSYFILNLNNQEIEIYLKPLLEKFNILRNQNHQEDFFNKFVLAEDVLNKYENFWTVWNIFYPKIVAICKNTESHQFNHQMDNQIIRNYLLFSPWKESAKSWHTLKDRERLFFKKVSQDIGNHPTVLFSIAKLLNDIGSAFKDDGVLWISDIIKNNPSLYKVDLETNTISYIENIIRNYIFEHRQIIKVKPQRKEQILIVLNFLIEKGSAIAYRLREVIL